MPLGDVAYTSIKKAYGSTPECAWKNLEKAYPVSVDMPSENEEYVEDEWGRRYFIEEVDIEELFEDFRETLEEAQRMWKVIEDKVYWGD